MYTFLIIDDEELIRKGTIKKLSPMSDKLQCIGEAENGADGIEKIRTLNPDIVILDMQMPIMDGTQLLPYLSEHFPDLPLIVISGYRDFDYIKHAISAKAIDYILKPFSKEAIQKCMTDALTRLENKTALQNQIISSEAQKETAYYEYDLQILRNLILGYHTDTTSISSKKLNFINKTHNLMLLTLHFSKIAEETVIQSWLEENGFGDLALYLINPNDKQMGFLLLFLPEDSVFSGKQLAKQLTEIMIPWMEHQNLPVLIGISNTHSDLQ